MITPQLTEQYGQVLRVSVVRAILSPCVCAYTGPRLNPNTETPAPPIKVVLMKVRLETSMTGTPSNSNCEIADRTTRGCSNRGEIKASMDCCAGARIYRRCFRNIAALAFSVCLWPRIFGETYVIIVSTQ